MASPPRPMCFIAMPFGKKPSPVEPARPIDFDSVFATICGAVEAEGIECVRADYDPAGGFIHRSMFERLLVAEYVIADLTFGNANVAYEVGLRHGASTGLTLLVCEEKSLGALPFDLRPLRIIPYGVTAQGTLDAACSLASSLRAQLARALRHELPPDNPLQQVTALRPCAVGHEKTDVFMQRMEYVSAVGREVATCTRSADAKQAVARLDEIAAELRANADVVRELHTALLSVLLGYRAMKAWERMTVLYEQMPRELQESPVAREQMALALNRLAEDAAAAGDLVKASELRKHALERADLPDEQRTSETYGIRGRIYKGMADAEAAAGNEARSRSALGKAIEEYEAGFRLDPRDYYPGVNALTLRQLRRAPGDDEAVAKLRPVVRFAADRAPAPRTDDERYWLAATRLELASGASDWPAADEALLALLALAAAGWMLETTADNLDRLRKANFDDVTAAGNLKRLGDALRDAARG